MHPDYDATVAHATRPLRVKELLRKAVRSRRLLARRTGSVQVNTSSAGRLHL